MDLPESSSQIVLSMHGVYWEVRPQPVRSSVDSSLQLYKKISVGQHIWLRISTIFLIYLNNINHPRVGYFIGVWATHISSQMPRGVPRALVRVASVHVTGTLAHKNRSEPPSKRVIPLLARPLLYEPAHYNSYSLPQRAGCSGRVS